MPIDIVHLGVDEKGCVQTRNKFVILVIVGSATRQDLVMFGSATRQGFQTRQDLVKIRRALCPGRVRFCISYLVGSTTTATATTITTSTTTTTITTTTTTATITTTTMCRFEL